VLCFLFRTCFRRCLEGRKPKILVEASGKALAFLFHFSCPFIFSLFSLEEFWIPLHVFVDRPRNVSSREIDVHSSFWGHHRILWFLSSVNETVEEVAIHEETSEE